MRNVIQMALKLVAVFAKKLQKLPGGLGLCSPTPFCATLELHQFAHHAALVRDFPNKRVLISVQPPFSLTKSCLRAL